MTNPLKAIDDAIEALKVSAEYKYGDGAFTAFFDKALTNLKAAREALDSEEMVEKVAKSMNPSAFEEYQTRIDYQIKDGASMEKAKEFADWGARGSGELNIFRTRELARAAIAALKGERDA